MKQEFIKREILLLTIAGAFSRNKIYRENVDDEEKKTFKIKIGEYLDRFLLEYKNKVNEDSHCSNLNELESLINENSKILHGGSISFGTVQKLLNLYLKYLWCLDEIQEPPHCPIDSIVLKMIEGESQTRWTKMDEGDYQRIISKLKDNKAKNKKSEDSIAKWELREFSGR